MFERLVEKLDDFSNLFSELDSGNKGWILPAKLKVALAKKIKEKIGDGEVENDERNFKEAFENMEKKRLQKITYEDYMHTVVDILSRIAVAVVIVKVIKKAMENEGEFDEERVEKFLNVVKVQVAKEFLKIGLKPDDIKEQVKKSLAKKKLSGDEFTGVIREALHSIVHLYLKETVEKKYLKK